MPRDKVDLIANKVGWNSINVHFDVECTSTWWSVKIK